VPDLEAFGLQGAISHPGNPGKSKMSTSELLPSSAGPSVPQVSTAAHVLNPSQFFDFDQASNTAATIPQDGDSTKFNIEDPKGKRAAPTSTPPPQPTTAAPPSDTYLEQHKASVITSLNLSPDKEHDLHQLLQTHGWPTPYETLTKVEACRRGEEKWEWDEDDDALLKGICELIGRIWDNIAASFFVGKTKYDCAERYGKIVQAARERETLGQ
jgi:hypothetical protein